MFHGERGLNMHLGINGLLVLSGDELVSLFMYHFWGMATSIHDIVEVFPILFYFRPMVCLASC